MSQAQCPMSYFQRRLSPEIPEVHFLREAVDCLSKFRVWLDDQKQEDFDDCMGAIRGRYEAIEQRDARRDRTVRQEDYPKAERIRAKVNKKKKRLLSKTDRKAREKKKGEETTIASSGAASSGSENGEYIFLW